MQTCMNLIDYIASCYKGMFTWGFLQPQRGAKGRGAFAQSRLNAGLGVFIAAKAKGKTRC